MSKMKNMLIIKDIKSNLIEEAIVVFKENVKIKEEQTIKNSINERNVQNFESDLCIKEAESVIGEYIKNIENKRKENNLKIKLKFLKILNIALVLTLLLVLIF